MSIGWRQLLAAGFKVHKGYRRKFYVVTAPNGDDGVVLRQSPNKWHFFWRSVEASASGHSPETCMKGGLGDVIGTDGELRSYKRMMIAAPDALLTQCDGLYRCSSDAYND